MWISIFAFLFSKTLLAAPIDPSIFKNYQVMSAGGMLYSAEHIQQEPSNIEGILKSTVQYGQCSGTLISRHGHVLTALHCLEDFKDKRGAGTWGKIRNPANPRDEDQGYMIPASAFNRADTILTSVNDWLRKDFGRVQKPSLAFQIIFKGAGVPSQYPSYLEDEGRFLISREEIEAGKKLYQDFAIIKIQTSMLERPWACAKIRTQDVAESSTVYAAGYPIMWGKDPEANYVLALSQGQAFHSERAMPANSSLVIMEDLLPENSTYFTTAATARGMSGGGMFNSQGELIGVNNAGQGRVFSKRSYQSKISFILDKIRETESEASLKFMFDCP